MKKLLCIFIALATAGALGAQSAEEIADRMDAAETYTSATMTGSLIQKDRFGTKRSDFDVYQKGKDRFLLEFTSLDEEGQKILRIQSSIYLYYPDAEELILLQGSALRQSVLGTDVSYEDMADDKSTKDKYDLTLEGEERVNGYDCWILMMDAKTSDVAYAKQRLWIDKESALAVKGEFFARSGTKLKEMDVHEMKSSGGRKVITKTVLKDVLKANSSTEFIVTDFEIGGYVDETLFSLEELSW